MWKEPLTTVQLTANVFYLAFIVFQTDQWWWSIEKKSEGIAVQRSQNYGSLLKM